MSRREIDLSILQMAAANGSVVHARDLRRAQVSRDSVARRIRSGWMAPVLPSTYAVGPMCQDPTREMLCMAGVAYAGPGAVLDGETAAVAIGGWNRPSESIHVTGPGCFVAVSLDPFVFHRAPDPWAAGPSLRRGAIPIAAYVDMCVTLSRTMTSWQLAFVIDHGIYEELVTLAELDAAIAARRGAPWVTVLRDAVALVRSGSAGTRSGSEDELLAGLLDAGAEPPIVNTRGALGLPSEEPDMVWPQARLNVEVDGRQHLKPVQAAVDEARDRVAIAEGWRVIRVQASAVWRRRRSIVRRILQALDEPLGPLDQDTSRTPRRILIK